jgi:hypothetical protein
LHAGRRDANDVRPKEAATDHFLGPVDSSRADGAVSEVLAIHRQPAARRDGIDQPLATCGAATELSSNAMQRISP